MKNIFPIVAIAVLVQGTPTSVRAEAAPAASESAAPAAPDAAAERAVQRYVYNYIASSMELMADGMEQSDGTLLFELKLLISLFECCTNQPVDGLPADYQAYLQGCKEAYAPGLAKLEQIAADVEAGRMEEYGIVPALEPVQQEMQREQEALAARYPEPAAVLGGAYAQFMSGRLEEALDDGIADEVTARAEAYFKEHPEIRTPQGQMAAVYRIIACLLREKAEGL